MSEDFIIITTIFAILGWLCFFIYQSFRFYNVNNQKGAVRIASQKASPVNQDYSTEFNYFLDNQPATEQEFQKEQSFLIHYIEKNNSFKHLSDCYERVEIYLDFKLSQTLDYCDKQSVAYYKQKYQQMQQVVAEKFEEKSNHLLGTKMQYTSDRGFQTEMQPTGLTNKCLAVELLKLKSK